MVKWIFSGFILIMTLFWLNPMANLTVKHGQYGPILTTLTIPPVLIIALSFQSYPLVEKEPTKDSASLKRTLPLPIQSSRPAP
ncbi:MAG: hypothetical protein LBS60_00220 [Deltaproteobacteria bacterium]|jgi:hypothetical protein|nr:hypothetical protein [Deltaproteobacteria bacterium]